MRQKKKARGGKEGKKKKKLFFFFFSFQLSHQMDEIWEREKKVEKVPREERGEREKKRAIEKVMENSEPVRDCQSRMSERYGCWRQPVDGGKKKREEDE